MTLRHVDSTNTIWRFEKRGMMHGKWCGPCGRSFGSVYDFHLKMEAHHAVQTELASDPESFNILCKKKSINQPGAYRWVLSILYAGSLHISATLLQPNDLFRIDVDVFALEEM